MTNTELKQHNDKIKEKINSIKLKYRERVIQLNLKKIGH